MRRWTSWYDPRLVTEEGEKILADLDTWAIEQLRRHRLVWSGWHGHSLKEDEETVGVDGLGIRRVRGIEPGRLRLFFLSLLWRAAATDLEEFAEVELSPEDLEQLRQMILTSDPSPLSFYPCQLAQLSTKGLVHNRPPHRDLKMLPTEPLGLPVRPLIELPTFRFYFDGLIAHMHPVMPLDCPASSLGPLIVGAESSLVLPIIRFENSTQRSDLIDHETRLRLDAAGLLPAHLRMPER